MKRLLLSLFFIILSLKLFSQIGFDTKKFFPLGDEPNNFFQEKAILIDIDNDGDKDAIVQLNLENKIVWFENLDGLGNFSRDYHLIYESKSLSPIAASDFDNDGDYDFFIKAMVDGHPEFLWLENKNSTWEDIHRIDSSSNLGDTTLVLTTDIDNDGDDDIILDASYITSLNSSTPYNYLRVYENTDGLGSFSYASENYTSFKTTVDNQIRDFKVMDVDNDSDLDIVTSSFNQNSIFWYEQNADNLFLQPKDIHSALDKPTFFSMDDMDGDGDIDLTVINNFNREIVMLQIG